MADFIKKDDVVRYYKENYPDLEPHRVWFSINDILDAIIEIRPTPALELNHNLEILLNQLGYVKVVRCRDCGLCDTKGCPMYNPSAKSSVTIGNGYCFYGDKFIPGE